MTNGRATEAGEVGRPGVEHRGAIEPDTAQPTGPVSTAVPAARFDSAEPYCCVFPQFST
jgi:hypothetical protein